MRKYPTQQDVIRALDYDPETGIFRHSAAKKKFVGDRAGKLATDGYRRIGVNGQTYQASWIAWIYMTGAPPREELDHINGVRQDDRFANLREATRSENCAGKLRFYRKNKHGYRGVKQNSVGNFAVTVTAKQKEHYVGTFTSLEEAARAYDVKAAELFGSFARLNFPTTVQRDWLFVHEKYRP